MTEKSKALSYLSMGDAYQRKARLAPGVLSVAVLLPAAIVLSVPLLGWGSALVSGAGLAALVAIGISHLASAMGNQYQRQIFPRWPCDAPTNRRLNPFDAVASKQQQARWYQSIKQITGLDVLACSTEDRDELDRVVNDAITEIRSRLWKHPSADRLHAQNTEYGFARNFAGLAPAWLPLSVASTCITTIGAIVNPANVQWAALSWCLSIGLYLFRRFVMRGYVIAKADHYADSFFTAMTLLDENAPTASTNPTHSPTPQPISE
ncbi:MAG: hypothetical protein WBD20_07640 [Pirellulaceae bacterium]